MFFFVFTQKLVESRMLNLDIFLLYLVESLPTQLCKEKIKRNPLVIIVKRKVKTLGSRHCVDHTYMYIHVHYTLIHDMPYTRQESLFYKHIVIPYRL